VITEGNYLLADIPPWDGIRDLLDIVWFVDTDEELRLDRLIERHVRFGKDHEAATAWAHGPDRANARYILSTRARADRYVDGR
jgi:pantothenate kinase